MLPNYPEDHTVGVSEPDHAGRAHVSFATSKLSPLSALGPTTMWLKMNSRELYAGPTQGLSSALTLSSALRQRHRGSPKVYLIPKELPPLQGLQVGCALPYLASNEAHNRYAVLPTRQRKLKVGKLMLPTHKRKNLLTDQNSSRNLEIVFGRRAFK